MILMREVVMLSVKMLEWDKIDRFLVQRIFEMLTMLLNVCGQEAKEFFEELSG